MEKTTQDIAIENPQQPAEGDAEIRTLKDLELFLVGGGDDTPTW